MPEKVFRQEMLWGRAIGIRDRERLRDWNFLRCRSTIKTIHKNHKLAFGSDSVIFMNNIVVQHQRKSTVPAEVHGPVFPSSVHRLFLLWFISFFKAFAPPFQYIARSSFSRAAPNVLPLFAAFPPPGPVPGKLLPLRAQEWNVIEGRGNYRKFEKMKSAKMALSSLCRYL